MPARNTVGTDAQSRQGRISDGLLWVLLAIFIVLLPLGGFGETRNWIRRDVPYTGALILRDLDGTDVELRVTGRETTSITVQWKDNTKKVLKTFTDAYGRTQAAEVSQTFGRTIKKENGIRVDGRVSEAYLVYTDELTGLKVYYYDTIGTEQNHYALLIEPGPDIVEIVTALTDPSKLATLDVESRAIGDRYQKLVAWLFSAEARGLVLEDALAEAMQANGTDRDRAALTIQMVRKSYELAVQQGWLTPQNLERMRRGESGIVQSGEYAGERLEVDHIVPIALHQEFANEMSNLQLLPRSVNVRKGAKLDEAGALLLERLRLLRPLGVPARAFLPSPNSLPTSPKPDFSIPTTAPTWTAIGDSLFFQGRLLTEQLTRDSAAVGLPRDVYVEERAWIEKQRAFGRTQMEAYDALAKQRITRHPETVRAKVEHMRKALLNPR